MLLSAEDYVPSAQAWAAGLDCFVATVEYRLAPGTRYAGSIEDNYSVLRCVYRHAQELGVGPARIAVMGESAGGGRACGWPSVAIQTWITDPDGYRAPGELE